MKSGQVIKNPEQKKLILIALVALIALIVFVNFLMKPTISEIVKINPELLKFKKDIETAQLRIKKQPELKKELEKMRSTIENYRTVLSAEEEIPSLLEELSDMAHKSRVTIIGIEPIRASGTKFSRGELFREVPISIKARSGYHRLGRFISRLESAERVFAVKKLEIQGRLQNPKTHDARLVVSTFLLSEI